MSQFEKFLNKKDQVETLLKEFREEHPYPVLSELEFNELINYINSIYGLKSFSKKTILSFLVKGKYIEDIKLKDYEVYKFSDANADSLDIAHSFFRKTHFSYFTALLINGLTLQIPKTIYLNYERPKLYPAENNLIQSRIDDAFSKPPRISNNITELPQFNILYLQSKKYDNKGIVPFRGIYKVTDIERTLIDVTVRPFYAGGVVEVLNAYEKAKDVLDISKLYGYYKSMDFIYPYHQAIGFYLQKAGYKESQYNLFKKFDFQFSFYLTYNMLHKNYSNEWNLYYPKGL